MEKLIKTLALVAIGVAIGRVGKPKDLTSVTVKMDLVNRDEYEKLVSDIERFEPILKQVKD